MPPPPIPAAPGPTAFFLGVPAGDAYALASLAVDASRHRAYVYCAQSADGGPVISVVDLVRREVLRLIPLPPAQWSAGGRVLLTPDGTRAYVVNAGDATLTALDPETGTPVGQVEDVRDADLSPDGARLFVIGEGGLRALGADALTPLWTIAGSRFTAVEASGEHVAVTVAGSDHALVVYDGATGAELARASLPDFAQGLAPGPEGGWAVRAGITPPTLLRFDANLNLVAQAEVPTGQGLFYDRPRRRYLLTGWQPSQSPAAGGRVVVVALAADDLTLLRERDWPSSHFAAYGDDALLAIARHGPSWLAYLDPETLEPTARVILGVRLVDMALDESAGTLYVADDQDRVHVLSLPDGRVQAVWPGSAAIALDVANGRLYVNRPEGVVALDSRTGDVVARYPQGGVPAPDPARDLVYIVQRGVTIYDRSGRELGRLESTFPTQAPSRPYAVAARVNPVTGQVVVIMNNGVPGSNNDTYLVLYPPAQDEPIPVPGFFTFVVDVTFDPVRGTTYASYSTYKNLEALQVLDPAGREIARLRGRTGHLAFDPESALLYVVRAAALARFEVDTLTLRDVYRAPPRVDQVLLNATTGQLYLRDSTGPRVHVLDLSALPPLDMRPKPVPGLPEEEVYGLEVTADGQGTLIYALVAGGLYRSRDGKRWEKLPVGSLLTYGYLTVAGPGVLFYTGQGPDGGDGVWRSRDAGESWDLLTAGLADLRSGQRVHARGAGEAYFVGKTGGIFAWRPAARRWERVLTPDNEFSSPGELSLAPDGTLFLTAYARLRRSTDGGRTWQDLTPPADLGHILGFSPAYTETQTLYGLFGADQPHLMRSPDGGLTWEQADRGLPLQPYSTGYTLLTHGQILYLHHWTTSAARLFRSLDGGDTWQQADPETVADTTRLAVAPDGRLWFGLKGGVRSLHPAEISWTPLGAVTPTPVPPTPTPTLSPTLPPPTTSPTPTLLACSRPLTGDELTLLSTFPALGCPLEEVRTIFGARQPFQRGQMIWRGDTGTILVLHNDGAWQQFRDEWQEGQPESDPTLRAPDGLLQPVRGFGKVWREQLGGPAAAIGWATAKERGVSGEVQAWQRGVVLRFASEVLVLWKGGTWEQAP